MKGCLVLRCDRAPRTTKSDDSLVAMDFSIDDIERARRRLEGVVKPTPLIGSATLARMLEAEVLLKPENLQKTGSFKLRGAYNRIAA